MKQALFILAVALYLVSLCACGDQKIQSKSKQCSATQQVVQEQMANAIISAAIFVLLSLLVIYQSHHDQLFIRIIFKSMMLSTFNDTDIVRSYRDPGTIMIDKRSMTGKYIVRLSLTNMIMHTNAAVRLHLHQCIHSSVTVQFLRFQDVMHLKLAFASTKAFYCFYLCFTYH